MKLTAALLLTLGLAGSSTSSPADSHSCISTLADSLEPGQEITVSVRKELDGTLKIETSKRRISR